MSCDRTKLKTNREIMEGAPPENNYRLSFNHAPSVGASWQYLNYNVRKLGESLPHFTWKQSKKRVCTELIFVVWALTLSLPASKYSKISKEDNGELEEKREKKNNIWSPTPAVMWNLCVSPSGWPLSCKAPPYSEYAIWQIQNAFKRNHPADKLQRTKNISKRLCNLALLNQ